MDKLSDHFVELTANHEDHQIKNSLWERVKKKIPGKPPKLFTVTELVTRETLLKLLISLLKTSLVNFSGHLFRAKWQQSYLKRRKHQMPLQSAVLLIDYAENYNCISQDEVQSAHWSNTSITIHPVMVFVNDTDLPGVFKKKESNIFISDDVKHDADGVAHFMTITYQYLKQKYPHLKHLEQFSDGAASQYKCAKSLCNIAEQAKTHRLSIRHNYFESSHGKSLVLSSNTTRLSQ